MVENVEGKRGRMGEETMRGRYLHLSAKSEGKSGNIHGQDYYKAMPNIKS